MPTGLTLADVYLVLTGRPASASPRSVAHTSPGADDEGVRHTPPLFPDRWATRVSSVVVDSRRVVKDSVFVALRGERTDGHLYVQDAFDRGAICAIVERTQGCGSVLDLRTRSLGEADGGPGVRRYLVEATCSFPVCTIVEDSLAALQRLAAWWRTRFAVRVIGITGSVGKTTTKEFVASVLAQRYRVLKSEGNYNNEIGLPLTLLELEEGYDRVVLEMGAYGPGEITILAKIARPHIGVVTNVGPVHLERMGTVERIAQAKSELPQALPPDGVAVLNADDEWVRSMAQVTSARVFTYGLTPDCDLWADEVESRGLDGVFPLSLRHPDRQDQPAGHYSRPHSLARTTQRTHCFACSGRGAG
jgi:UDP-N-acetylmuramoyl-tripeptide--D-alanyl-D-alanine ligase